MYYYDVQRDGPQADDDEPAGVWATSHDNGHVFDLETDGRFESKMMVVILMTIAIMIITIH